MAAAAVTGTRGRGIVPAAVFRMFSRNESQMPRFALLEHTGAPSDPTGRHFDLLLETASVCRTWRLMTLPEAGGAVVPAAADRALIARCVAALRAAALLRRRLGGTGCCGGGL